MSSLINTLKKLKEKALFSDKKLKELEAVIENFSFSITKDMYDAIDPTDQNDPIALQFIPDGRELNILAHEKSDPIGDNPHTTLKGLIHRYPDRCLLTPLYVCAVYCRFCFRREKVGAGSKAMTAAELEAAYAYIRVHTELWEVILTGGDPLFLKPDKLDSILSNLADIAHLGIIRIHTRIPVVEPALINARLLQALQKRIPIYVVIHANHPKEFTEEAKRACRSLADHGVPLLSQSVLLQGINDDIDTLSQLMRCFLENKIKPYYLHQGDLAQGTSHFRTTIKKGQMLMKQLRGRFSGLCQPTYILDIPGGYGKSPIGPQYLTECVSIAEEGRKYQVEDYQGKLHEYCEH